MDISPIAKTVSPQQASTFQQAVHETVSPRNQVDAKTIIPQAVKAAEKSSDSVRIKYSATSKNLETVRSIEDMHSRLNQLAKGTRETNEALNSTAETIEKLQTTLQKIIKNYPPFSADSPERQKILMSYISIRKEMEKLMIPPPPVMVHEKVKGMWESLFKDGQIATPNLNATSTDAEIEVASSGLEKTVGSISELSDGMLKAFIQG